MTKNIVIQDSQTQQILADGTPTSLESNYYFAKEEVNLDQLIKKDKMYHCPIKNADCDYYYLPTNLNQEIAWCYDSIPNATFKVIEGKIGFYGKKSKLVEIVEL